MITDKSIRYKNHIRIALLSILYLKLLDVISSYIGMRIGLVETNPLPAFYLAAVIFVFMILFILYNFDVFFATDDVSRLKFSLYCFVAVILFQSVFVLNNMILILQA